MRNFTLSMLVFLAIGHGCGKKNSGDDSWNDWQPSTLVAPRAFHCAAFAESSVHIWGGIGLKSDSRFPLANGGIFNTTTSTWSTFPLDNSPTARSFASCIATENEWFIFGGMTSSGSYLNSAAIYSFKNKTWTTVSQTNAPSARAGAVLTLIGRKIFIFGGWSDSLLSDGKIFDLDLLTWSSIGTTGLPSIDLSKRPSLPKLFENDRIIEVAEDWLEKLFTEKIGLSFSAMTPPWTTGSYDSSTNRVYLFGWKNHSVYYDVNSDLFVTIDDSALGSLVRPHTFSSDGKITLVDGAGVYSLNTSTHQWSTFQQSPKPKSFAASAKIEGNTYLWGGLGERSYLKSLWSHDGSNWDKKSERDAPMGRFGHTVTATRDALYVFGGVPLPYSAGELLSLMGNWNGVVTDMKGGIYLPVAPVKESKDDVSASCPRNPINEGGKACAK